MGASQRGMVALINAFLELLYPSHCAACGLALGVPTDARRAFCAVCADTLVPGDGTSCPLCGVMWLDAPVDVPAHPCGRCQAEPPPWIAARGAYAYGGALQDAIARWKNQPDESLGPRLAQLLCDAAARTWVDLPADARIVPIPATRAGLARRGFNPAGMLARRLARRLDRRFEPRALRFRHEPEKSRGLGRRQRERRMRGVFDGHTELVAGRSVLLVDDVMTTGATVRSATQALLRAGARGVRIAVLARVPGDAR